MSGTNGRTARGKVSPMRLLCGASLAAVALALPSLAHAQQDRNWDPNGTAVNSGGAGTWDTSSNRWSPNADGVSGPYTPWNNAGIDNAIFGGPSGTNATVTLATPIIVHNLTVNASTTYTLTGSTLTLAGTTPTITTNGNVTISSILAGTAGLTKAGGGTLTLSGANTFSGGINLTQGRLNVSGDSTLGAASNGINLSAGATLFSTSALSASRVITLSGATGIGGGVGSAHITGTGSFSLIAQTGFTDDTNDFTGSVGTDGFNLYFTSIRNLGEASALGAANTVANGAVFVRNASAIYVGDGDTSNRSWNMAPQTGSSALRNQGTGTLTVTGDIAAGGGFTSSVILDAQTADLELLGVISSSLTGFANRPFIFAGSGTNRTITLSNANTFGGAATIQLVTVKANALADQGTVSSLGTGVDAPIISLNTGILSYVGAASSSNRGFFVNGASSILNDGTGALNLSGIVAFNAANPGDTLTLGGSFAGSNTLSGVISGNGNLVMSGVAGSTWLVSGANTFTGSTTVTSGTLQVGNAQAFGAANAFVVNGGALDLNGFDRTVTSLSGTGGSVALGSAELTVNGATSTTYAGSITGTGSLVKRGTSTFTLSGQSTYSGDTTINGGTVALNFAAAGAPASDIIASTSTLNMAGGSLILTGAAGVANSQTFDGLNVTAGNNRITATSGAGGNMTLNLGALTRTGGLLDITLPASGTITTTNGNGALGWATVNGADYAQVSGGVISAFTAYANKDDASTWLTGDVVSDEGGAANTPYVNAVAGDIQLGGLKYTAAANSTATVGAANTLGVDGTIIVASSVGNASQTITGGSVTGSAGGGALGVLHNGTGTGTFTIASTITDNGGTAFIKGGTGRVALTGANSYTGGTTLSGGTLAISSVANGGVASSLGASTADSANLVIESGTLEFTTNGAGTTDRGFTLVNGGPSRTIQVTSAGGNLTFGGVVVGPDDASLTKTGAGTLTLANDANTYTGVTTVSAGTLSVDTLANGGAASGIGASTADSANLVLQGTGGLQYTGATDDTDRGFTLGTGGGRIDVTDGAAVLTVSGVATGTGGLTKEGAGTLILSGVNTYSGGTAVSAGTLRAGSAQAFGNPGALMDVATGATLDLGGFSLQVGALGGGGNVLMGSATLTTGGTNGTFTGTISGSGAFVRSGGGTQTIIGCNNSYAGATSIASSVLSVDCLANGGLASGIGASSNASANLSMSNATLVYTGGSTDIDRGMTVGGTAAVNVSNAATTLGIGGSIIGTGALRKDGAGTLVLSGNNTFIGGLVVNGGIVRAGSTTALGARAVTMTNAAGVMLDLAGFDSAIAVLNGGGAAGGNIALGTGTLTLNWGSGGASFAGAISGSGGLVKTGAFTQALTGCGSSYTGSTAISGGVLQVSCLADGGSNSAIGAADASAGKLIISGGTLQYVGAGGSTDRLFTLGASSASRLEASGTGAIAFTGTGPIAFVTPGTTQAIALGGTNAANNSLAAQITNNGAGVTSLTKDGVGTWILNNPNSSYTGITTINGGVLGVSKLSNGGLASSIGASSAAAANLVIGNGSTLRYTGAGDTTNRLFTLSAGTTFLESSGTGAIVFTDTGPVTLAGADQARTIALGGTNAGNNTLAGAIGNAGTGVTVLAKNDAGTWLLTGNNTYTGNTNINAGRLVLGNGGTTGSIASGTVNNLGTLGFNRSDTLSYAGVIAGTGAVQQIGAGITVLTGTNAYTGGTTISAGTLQLGNGGTTGSITGNVATAGDGVLAFNRSNAVTFAGLISGTGGVRQSGTGTTILTGVNTYTGGTTISGGVLQVSSDANLGDATGGITFNGGTLATTTTFTSNRDIIVNGAGTIATTAPQTWTVAGDITGGGSLTKTGTGTLVLTGGATHTGGTTIAAGTLQIGNGSTTGSIAGDIVNNATLSFDRSDSYTYDGAISGSGSLIVNGGILSLTADSSYAGNTTVNTGDELRIVSGNTVASAGSTSISRGILTVSGTGSTFETGVISGTSGIASATINVQDGGTIRTTSGGLTLRTLGGTSAANLNISGAGSLMDLAGPLLASTTAGSTSNLTISDGGALRSTGANAIGAAAGNTTGSTVTITGAGSNWTSSGTLTMTNGDFSLLAGGTASFASATIGSVDEGADLLVSGTNSAFTTTGDLVVGTTPGDTDTASSGTITLADGGRLSVGGTFTLAGDATATGILNIGAAAGDPATAAGVLDTATLAFGPGTGELVFNHTNTDYQFATGVSGTGTIRQIAGDTNLTGNSAAFTGTTMVTGGVLRVNGTLGGATSLVTVLAGGRLGGGGVIGGDVNVADGVLAPGNSPGALAIAGNLTLTAASLLDFEFGLANAPGDPLNDVINIGGDLVLDGTLNVTQSAGGSFGPGVYRILNYAGLLTDNGLTVGSLPSGTGFVQTAIANQVNLVNTAGLTLNFWDGAAGPKNDGAIQGGSGTWRVGGGQNDWTEANGLVNADYAQDSFAIFQGAGGTVTVDNSGGSVSASGMQFTVDGYTIAGGPLVLSGAQAFVRVGDGGAGDAGLTATVGAALTGSAQLVKDMGGTLVLTGANSYTGGTAINGGTIRISQNLSLGDNGGTLSFNGGRLNTTADMGMIRNIDLVGNGTFDLDPGTLLTVNGVVSGSGSLVKDGAGLMVVTASNTYAGVTTVNAGILQVGSGTSGSILGDVVNNAQIAFARSDSVVFAGTISGGGSLSQLGAGMLTLTADNGYTGTTTISNVNAGTLQLGNGGTTGSIGGNVVNGGTLIFNRSNEYSFAGTISGAGAVRQEGTGTTILTADNSYTGSTVISSGTLLINGNQTAAVGTTNVLGGGTLGGTGTIGGDVFVGGGATLTPGDATGPGTLTINGNLGFSPNAVLAYDFGRSDIVGGPLNDLTEAAGDLALDGTIDVAVSPGGSFGPGLYRVISYGGTLADNGLTVGAMPAGSTVAVQTSIGGQVNLVNAAGGTFNFWDGAAPANESNNLVDGGDGIWQNSSGNNDWTTTDSAVSGAYTDGTFAIFAAAAGTVEIDNGLGAVAASGLQFASDGYTITGENLTLVGPESVIRVGDGTAAGLGMTATIETRIFGATQLVKTDLGTLVLTRANTYTDGTRIDAGTLRISSDIQLGDAAGALSLNGGTLNTTVAMASGRSVNLLGTGTLLTDAGTSLTLFGLVSGAGGFTKAGTGILMLAGNNSFGGDVDVTAGQMFVNGDQSAATGATSVASGATLSGSGIIGGNVALADGATLDPGGTLFGVGTLTINGSLALSSGSALRFQFGEANVAGGALNDLVNVGGDLTLDGTIDALVPAGGSFGPGIYRVFNYGGLLTDNGLSLGAMPGGSAVSLQTAVAGQVNLVNTAGLTLGFWDGNAGPKNNGVVNGGNGVWRAAGGLNNWTDTNGSVNADYAQDSFAIFSAAPGTVTVDNVDGAVRASGMQFASNGYVVGGGPLTLTGAQAIVQVGDGSAASAGFTATVAVELAGTAGLVKTDAGRLILTGANSYTGGTTIDGGTLQIGNGGATGSITGDIANNGALVVNRSGTLSLDGTISGSGSLSKTGSGALILGGANSYAGGTTVSGGTVRISSDANLGDVAGALSLQGGMLQAGASFTSARDILVGSPTSNRIDTQGFDVTLTGTIGNGANNQAGNFLDKIGSGTLTLSGANIYANRTVISGGTLALAGAGRAGVGNIIVGAGTVFDISQTNTGARVIQLGSGPAGTIALGSKMLTLGLDNSFSDWSGTITDGGIAGGTGGSVVIAGFGGAVRYFEANSYTGGTTVLSGSFELVGSGSLHSGGAVAVHGGVFDIAGLAGAGTTIGDLSGAGGGAGAIALGGKSLTFGTGNSTSFTGMIAGAGGALVKTGTGTFTMSGANSYTGATDVSAGTLLVNGNQSAATGLTSVASGAMLGGTGTIGGDVVIADGATLAPGAGGAGALTINGDLSLGVTSQLAFEFGRANAPGDPLNDVVNVGGDLTLDGTLNVATTPGGAFDIGLYRIANYNGTLTDNGLALGALPAGADVLVQTAVANQVNLINVGGATLNFWDGSAGANKFNNAVDGGGGMWRTALDNSWTEATGAVNAAYDNGAFAIFAGTGGLVTIDNGLGTVTASGLQFAASGYRIQGGALTLTGPQSVIRVGDGTSAGIGYSAVITSEITGSAQLVKTDLGRLELTGTNTYTGGTAINGGTVRISSDANLGAASGGLSFNGGTLNTTADLISARAVDLAGQGVFSTNAGTTITLTGNLTGAGLMGKLGTGTLVLAGTGSHSGGIEVVQGTLLVNGDYGAATGLVTMNQIATLGGTGTIGGDVNLGGTLAPGSGGVGTLTINGDLLISQTTTLAYEFGQAGAAGGALNDLVNVGGNLVLDGTIDVTVPAGGAFDVGVYRVFNYGGTLTDNGLTLGTLPGGGNVAVQTSIAGQVNLVNSAGLVLGFWDGATGPKNDGVIQGGNGIWQTGAGNDNWTNTGGTVNGAYSDGAFAIFGGTGGAVTVDNSLGQVTAAGMQFAANGYTIAGEGVTLVAPQSTFRVGDGSAAGSGFTATINAALTGDTQLIKTDAGTLVLGGANGYTGGTAINGGTVQISTDANLGAASGGVTLDGGTLAASASLTSARDVALAGTGTISTASGTIFTLNGRLTGTGAFTKAGAGTLVLTGDSSGYAGSTRVSGTLAVNGSLCGDVNVLTGARLQGTGTVCTTHNAGTVAPGNSIGTLTIAGNYTSAGGRLEIEAVLGGDASPTDRLVVTGSTSGTTEIEVINMGGTGAATVEGIKIVDVTGGTSAGTFMLNGDYEFHGSPAVIAGAYGYRLFQGGVSTPTDGDWYLRSALLVTPNEPQVPLYQPGVPIYEAYNQALLALTELGTLQQRVGNRQWAQAGSGRSSGIWGRMQSNRSRPNAAFSASMSEVNIDSWKIELGADHMLTERGDGATLVLGVLGGYGEANASIGSIYGSGSIKAKSYSAGATLTWFGSDGFYVDGRAQVSRFDSKLKSAVLGTLASGNDGTGQAYSLEVGKRARIGRTLGITPQIQTVYSTVGFDRFTDPNDAAVSSNLGDSLKTRWGLSIDHQDGRSRLYSVANLSYEWLDGTVTDVSGTRIARENHRLWGEIGVGGSLLLGDRVTLYTEVSADTAINDFGDSYSLKGTAGLRLAF